MVRRPRHSGWKSGLLIISIGLAGVAIAITVSHGAAPSVVPPGRAGPSSTVRVERAANVASATASNATAQSASPSLGPTQRTRTPSPQPPSTPTVRPASTPIATRHVWWIIMENHEYDAIVGSNQAPYLNMLAARYGLATRYYATSHPSEPNYISLVAGSTLGVTSDGVYHLAATSIFSQLARARLAWRVYAQDDQTGCFTGITAGGGRDGPGAAGLYARKHNPAISLTSVASNSRQCGNIQPLRTFDPNAAPFEVIVPNLTNDMHDGTIGQGDAFLRAFVPQILRSGAFKASGSLFVTFDEGSSNAGSLGDRGGHVATLIIAPGETRGYRFRGYADHWSLLRTTENILGLPCLANSCQRSPIRY
jgi:phosphatidylinositol-3-phosphatase